VNYFLDNDHLSLDERNIFTATELITLKPMCGKEHYEALIRDNDWVKEYYPRFMPLSGESNRALRWWPKRLLEWLLKPFAPMLDSFVMRKLTARARRLHAHRYDQGDFEVAFKATPHVSKNHAGNYQRRITDKFHRSVASFFGEMIQV
jgi:hypothetical protein